MALQKDCLLGRGDNVYLMADLNVATAARQLSVRLAVIIYRGQHKELRTFSGGVLERHAVRSLRNVRDCPKNARHLKAALFERAHVGRYNAECFSCSMNLRRGLIFIKCTRVKL